jgi:hypothetical protein
MLGSFLTILLSILAYKDYLDRDVNLELVAYLGNRLVPYEFKHKIESELDRLKELKIKRECHEKRLLELREYDKYKKEWIPFIASPRYIPKHIGEYIYLSGVGCLFVIDIILGYIYQYNNYLIICP